jgi:hypothetical protein
VRVASLETTVDSDATAEKEATTNDHAAIGAQTLF